MEAKDEVVSEVHHFSQVAHPMDDHSKRGKSVFVEPKTSLKMNELSLVDKGNHLEEKEEGDECEFTCLLGSNGQVLLWSPLFETVLSRFEFSYPHLMEESLSLKKDVLNVTIDEDGDLEVLRKKDLCKKEGVVIIEHQSSTTLELVGEQVWRGAFFLADFILDNVNLFRDANVLEMAAGVGFSSVVAGMLANKVIVTDVDKGDILNLIHRNVKRNSDLCVAKTHVKEIDFFDLATIADLGALKDDVTVLIAADVVYHNQLTDAFLNAVLRLMRDKPDKVLFVALEKRYVFTIEDMDTVAPCYEHFVTGLQWLRSQETSRITWCIEEVKTVELPQYFTYERTKDLVLWKIEARLK